MGIPEPETFGTGIGPGKCLWDRVWDYLKKNHGFGTVMVLVNTRPFTQSYLHDPEPYIFNKFIILLLI